MNIKEMLEKRATCVNNARAIYNKAQEEKREPTAEETQSFDRLMKEAVQLKEQVEKIQADQKRIADLEAAEKDLDRPLGRVTQFETKDSASNEKKIFNLNKSICGDTRNIILSDDVNYRNAFNSYLVHGDKAGANVQAALQKDSDTAGGYLSAPMEFMGELIKAVDNAVFMRQIARVLPPLTSADSIGAPSLDNDPADPTWTSELAIGSEDSTMSFGKRELKPHPVAQYIKVSKTLLRRSAIGAEAIVRDRLAYKLGVVMENAYMNGTGAGQPLGIFTASNNGISTARDVSSGNSDTAIAIDGLKSAKYALKPQYRNIASWIFHTDALEQISKLKDGDGRYLWQPSVQIGQPDRLLNLPFYESEYAPNTFTTGKYVGILGDFSKYWIADSLTMTIQVLLELYAATNQNGYITRAESDGMPVLEEAFARVTLG